MKYENEKMFVENFAKDVKNETSFEVNGKEFRAEYVGKNSGMQAIYKVTLDGMTKEMNITQLKKRLGVTYTRECSRTGEQRTATKFIEKTEQELADTALAASDKIMQTYKVIVTLCDKYGLDSERTIAMCAQGLDLCDDRLSTLNDHVLGTSASVHAQQLQPRRCRAHQAVC